LDRLLLWLLRLLLLLLLVRHPGWLVDVLVDRRGHHFNLW
jgi:hypothetical protein